MLLSATSEALASCGRTLWSKPLRAHGILQAGRSRPRYESGATGIGKLENGSMPEAISESAAQKVFARAGSRKPRSDQHQECSTTDNHGYRRLACRRRINGLSPRKPRWEG